MDNLLFQSQKIDDRSQLAFIKREIHNLVKPFFSISRTGEVDLVIAEMLSNVIKYAGSGEILYRISKDNRNDLLEVICIDNGPGIHAEQEDDDRDHKSVGMTLTGRRLDLLSHAGSENNYTFENIMGPDGQVRGSIACVQIPVE